MDELFFSDAHAMLRTEYNELYATLFKRPENYLMVIKLLTERKEGYTRKEISEKTKLGGAALTKVLSDLEQCDFVLSYSRYGNSKNNAIYRIKDFYTLFYYKYVQGKDTKDAHRWTHLSSTPQVMSWQGFSFELLCLLHLDEIKKSLGIDRILNDASAWRSKQTEQNTQIDLVIERADRNINLCEMKFSTAMYMFALTKDNVIRGRLEYDRAKTGRHYSILLHPEAIRIIEKYKGEKKLLRFSEHFKNVDSATVMINKKLAKVRPGLTTYYARHTWASIAFNNLGIPKDVVSLALGHSFGVRVTDTYINADLSRVDEANRRVIDYVLYNKK